MTSRSRGKLDSDGGQRQYELDGELYWSVTTIIKGGIPMWRLNQWYQKVIAEAAVDNARELAKIKRRKDGRAQAIKWLCSQPDVIRDKAATRGKAVHRSAEAEVLEAVRREVWALLHDEPAEPVSEDVLPYLRGFRMWRHAFKPRFLATELEVYNFRHRYAGTLDNIFEVTLPEGDVIRVCGDYKSGKAIYDDAALQLAAYRNAEIAVARDKGGNVIDREPMTVVDETWVIHLKPDAFEVFRMRSDAEVFRYFLYAAQVHRWIKEGSKGVRESLVLPTDTFIPEVA